MPADVSARVAFFLSKIIEEAHDSPFVAFEKRDFFDKICYILHFSSPTSAWGIVFFLRGGKLVEERRNNNTSIFRIDVSVAKNFINSQNVFFEKTKDKKLKVVKK